MCVAQAGRRRLARASVKAPRRGAIVARQRRASCCFERRQAELRVVERGKLAARCARAAPAAPARSTRCLRASASSAAARRSISSWRAGSMSRASKIAAQRFRGLLGVDHGLRQAACRRRRAAGRRPPRCAAPSALCPINHARCRHPPRRRRSARRGPLRARRPRPAMRFWSAKSSSMAAAVVTSALSSRAGSAADRAASRGSRRPL